MLSNFDRPIQDLSPSTKFQFSEFSTNGFSDDARLTMAKCYLEERLKLSGDHSHDQTEFEEKLKTFVSQMYKGELVSLKNVTAF